MVVALPAALFPYTVDQKFWLVALPNLIGAVMRIPYTFAVTRFGGRTWTVISALLLLIPVVGLIYAVTARPPYWVVLLCAASAGFGGGNFASSMTNISFFYPERKKGAALGINAAGGNIGISSMQLVVPLVVAFGLVYAGLIWVPLVLAAAVCAYLFMNNLAVARHAAEGAVCHHQATRTPGSCRCSTSERSARSSATRPPSRSCSSCSSRMPRRRTSARPRSRLPSPAR